MEELHSIMSLLEEGWNNFLGLSFFYKKNRAQLLPHLNID